MCPALGGRGNPGLAAAVPFLDSPRFLDFIPAAAYHPAAKIGVGSKQGGDIRHRPDEGGRPSLKRCFRRGSAGRAGKSQGRETMKKTIAILTWTLSFCRLTARENAKKLYDSLPAIPQDARGVVPGVPAPFFRARAGAARRVASIHQTLFDLSTGFMS